jgi:hypothetical protein
VDPFFSHSSLLTPACSLLIANSYFFLFPSYFSFFLLTFSFSVLPLFARLRTRRLTAAFSAALLVTAMFTAALFFASCGSADEAEDISLPPPPPKKKLSPASNLVMTPQNQYLLPDGSTSITVRLNGTLIDPGEAGLTLNGQSDGTTRISEDGKLVIGSDQEPGQLTISSTCTDKNGATVNATAVVVVIDTSKTNIKEKFVTAPTLTGAKAVNAAFRELSAFIEKEGLAGDVIKLNDYIDLEGGLSVDAYKEAGGFSYADDPGWDTEITINSNREAEHMGYMKQLIVVGINSFKDTGSYKYPKGSSEPDPPDHVVFQFQNAPVTRRMNATDSNTGGYPASEMREYLTRNFLAGLEKAGVPEDVLWGPKRVVATKKEDSPTETINDLLWLPTEREMYGKYVMDYLPNMAAAVENENNQAKLEYYEMDVGGPWNNLTEKAVHLFHKTTKTTNGYPASSNKSATNYWLATAPGNVDGFFCFVDGFSAPNQRKATIAFGVAPAFCVYGLKPQQ